MIGFGKCCDQLANVDLQLLAQKIAHSVIFWENTHQELKHSINLRILDLVSQLIGDLEVHHRSRSGCHIKAPGFRGAR